MEVALRRPICETGAPMTPLETVSVEVAAMLTSQELL